MRHVLLPAAGASSRMRGRDKLMEDVNGQPCLRVMAKRALSSAVRVFVTLPSLDHPRTAALKGLPAEIIETPDHTEGMAASLRRGAAAAQGPLMILPPDMPALTEADLATIWTAYDALPKGHILRATTDDQTPGHPVVFSEHYLPHFAALKGDQGAAPILRQYPKAVVYHSLQNSHASEDLDTPEAWAQWRAAYGSAR